MAALQRPVMKQNMSSSDSFGSIDEEVLKELKNVPAVLATQDELDLVDVVKGLQDRLKVQPPTTSALPQEVIPAKQAISVNHSVDTCNLFSDGHYGLRH